MNQILISILLLSKSPNLAEQKLNFHGPIYCLKFVGFGFTKMLSLLVVNSLRQCTANLIQFIFV